MIRALASLLFPGRKRTGVTDPRVVAFSRGLALGALVGAAIAGSSLWKRLRRPTTR